MHDRGAVLRRAPDLGEIQEIVAVGTVKPHHVVAEAFQVLSYRRADVTPMTGDEKLHTGMISRRYTSLRSGAPLGGSSGRRSPSAT